MPIKCIPFFALFNLGAKELLQHIKVNTSIGHCFRKERLELRDILSHHIQAAGFGGVLG